MIRFDAIKFMTCLYLSKWLKSMTSLDIRSTLIPLVLVQSLLPVSLSLCSSNLDVHRVDISKKGGRKRIYILPPPTHVCPLVSMCASVFVCYILRPRADMPPSWWGWQYTDTTHTNWDYITIVSTLDSTNQHLPPKPNQFLGQPDWYFLELSIGTSFCICVLSFSSGVYMYNTHIHTLFFSMVWPMVCVDGPRTHQVRIELNVRSKCLLTSKEWCTRLHLVSITLTTTNTATTIL